MAITKKPGKEQTLETSIKEDEIQKLIHKGGSVPLQTEKEDIEQSKKAKKVQLRLMPEVIEDIDRARKGKSTIVCHSRHTWILEAIAEKLKRETAEKENTTN